MNNHFSPASHHTKKNIYDGYKYLQKVTLYLAAAVAGQLGRYDMTMTTDEHLHK